MIESKPGCSQKILVNKKGVCDRQKETEQETLVGVVRMRGSILGIRIFMPIVIDPPLEHLHQ